MEIKLTKRGSSTMEYTSILILVMVALLVFQFYITRGFSGRWKGTGDVFGSGRQYDPRPFGTRGSGGGTLDCFWDRDTSQWVNDDCFRANCDCMLPRDDPSYPAVCTNCKIVTCGVAAFPDCGS